MRIPITAGVEILQGPFDPRVWSSHSMELFFIESTKYWKWLVRIWRSNTMNSCSALGCASCQQLPAVCLSMKIPGIALFAYYCLGVRATEWVQIANKSGISYMVLRIRYWLHEKKFLDVAKSLPQFPLYLRARLLILVSHRCVLAIFNTASVKAEEPKWKEALTVGSTQIPELVEVMEDHFEIAWIPSYWRQTIKVIKAKLWSVQLCRVFCFPWKQLCAFLDDEALDGEGERMSQSGLSNEGFTSITIHIRERGPSSSFTGCTGASWLCSFISSTIISEPLPIDRS